MQCNYLVPQLNISHSLAATWTHRDKGWGWSSGTYPTTLLTQKDIQALNITVQCDLLKIVDRDGKILTDGTEGTILVAPGILSMLTDFLDEQFANMTMEEMSDSLDE